MLGRAAACGCGCVGVSSMPVSKVVVVVDAIVAKRVEREAVHHKGSPEPDDCRGRGACQRNAAW
jgi:hypothetical protein